MAKILVCEPISDWFHTVERDIDPKRYDKFRLVAQELVWYLEGISGNIVQERWQIEQPKKVIKELKINEIIGNRYRTVWNLIT